MDQIALNLSLNSGDRIPLYRQIYEQIRAGIISGEFPPGSRLPSSRYVSQSYRVARVTVTAAYQQLKAEGYLESEVGSGTFVNKQLAQMTYLSPDSRSKFTPPYSRWGIRALSKKLKSSPKTRTKRLEIDFGFGRSFPHIFPYSTWRRLLIRYLSTDDSILSRYGSVAGFYPLREAIADYVRRMRGVECNTDQVVIVNGMQQALDILARLFLNDGDEVLVETPGYAGAFRLFEAYGAKLIALPVDDEGFPVEMISDSCSARFAFVTPSNQFPRGGTMPLVRRLALIEWARKADAIILEDDYDGELRYSEHPLAALQGLDQQGRVVYLGTFSKVLFPALRLGYVVLPENLRQPFIQAMELIDRGAPTLTQAAVADFIEQGHFENHLRRLRIEYGDRRRVLVHALERYFADTVQYSKVEAGLHIMLRLNPGLDEQEVVRDASAEGVGVYPGEDYHIKPPSIPSILLGYSGLKPSEIEEGVRRLARVINRLS